MNVNQWLPVTELKEQLTQNENSVIIYSQADGKSDDIW